MFVKASEIKVGDVILSDDLGALVVEDVTPRADGYPDGFLTLYTYVRNDPPRRGRRYMGPNYVVRTV